MSNIVIRREQCPKCAAKGLDNSCNNLAVYEDGRKILLFL